MSTDLVPQPHGGAIHQGRPPGYLNPNAGRPSALTTEVREAILKAIGDGNYAHVAAAKAGITEKTFYEWLQKGSKGIEPFREFSEQVLTSASEAENDMLEVLRSAATETVQGDWKAAAWWLERRFPKRWGRQQRIEISTAPDNDMGWE